MWVDGLDGGGTTALARELDLQVAHQIAHNILNSPTPVADPAATGTTYTALLLLGSTQDGFVIAVNGATLASRLPAVWHLPQDPKAFTEYSMSAVHLPSWCA
jgi:hypothetical protein